MKLELHFPTQELISPQGVIKVEYIKAQSWPILGVPLDIETGKINARAHKWPEDLTLNHLTASLTYSNEVLTIHHSNLQSAQTNLDIKGQYIGNTYPYPLVDFNLAVTNITPFLDDLTQKKIVKKKASMFAGMALKAMEKDGKVQTTIKSERANVYLGPLKVFELPKREQPLISMTSTQ